MPMASANLVQGLVGDLVRASVAVVEDVLHVVEVAGELLAALANGGEVLVHDLGGVALELASAAHANLVCRSPWGRGHCRCRPW